MSTPGSPAAIEPISALNALIQRVVSAPRGIDSSPARDRIIDEFLGEWVVCKPDDIMNERAAQASWQSEAKVAFAVLVTALGNVNNQYPALTLGPRVLAEAERLIREKGMDPDEVLERFLP